MLCWFEKRLVYYASFTSLEGKTSKFVDGSLHALIKLSWDVKVCERVHAEAALGLPEEHLVVELAFLNLLDLVFVEPLDARAFFPEAVLEGLAWYKVGAKSVLLATAPVARVGTTV